MLKILLNVFEGQLVIINNIRKYFVISYTPTLHRLIQLYHQNTSFNVYIRK